jgi:hypothetical protein
MGTPKRGWWWYEKIPLEKKEPEKKNRGREKRSPHLSDYAMEELWNMYPDEFPGRLLMAFRRRPSSSFGK